MKRIGVCILSSLLFSIPLTLRADVSFSEIAWMGTKASQFAEWIELFNSGSTAVDLSGSGIYRGGTSLLFPLTKKIEPGGYLVIERTTASVPDALPGIDDEAGAFLGGGLSNTGEFLVLKDSRGVTLDSFDFRTGWPAGDNSTKETMQKNGTAWVTATATPKSALSLDAVVQASSGSSPDSTSTLSGISSNAGASGAATSVIAPDFSISVGRERLASVGSPLDFEARIDGASSGGIAYRWSFGDGAMSLVQKPSHSYNYPGDYVVVLNAGNDTVQAVARTVVHVIPVDVSFAIHPEDGRVDLSNNSSYEMNFGRWVMRFGQKDFLFPEDTILLPKKKISLARSTTNFTSYASTTPFLTSPNQAVSFEGVLLGSENLPSAQSTLAHGSNEAGLFLAELNELSRRLEELRAKFDQLHK